MNWVFICIYGLWCLFEILLNRLIRAKADDKQHADKNSLRLIWITMLISISASVFIAINYYFPIMYNIIIMYVGLSGIIIGVILRLLVIRSMGSYFTVDVTIRQDHKLKKDGFFKFLRHPSYFASLISFIGFGLSLNNIASLVIIVSCILIVFMYRIRVEEKVLIEYFGEEYIAYKATTKGLISFLY